MGEGAIAQVALHELALFAAAGFLVGALDELLVDLIWAGWTLWRRLTVYRRYLRADARRLAPPAQPGRIAVLVPAWDESAVIGAMLATLFARFGPGDYRVYVGCYPNDPATIAAVAAIAAAEPRLRPALCATPGPTTKADCLNQLWRALLVDEARDGERAKAVLLHDAEDVVHPLELAVIDPLIERFALVQLPVLPIVAPFGTRARFVSGHYCDEFAEGHGKLARVREALGAALPSAGVGCAIARDTLDAVAREAGGLPFDASSLTEDYELGLRVGATGGRQAFVWLRAEADSPAPVAVSAHFPETMAAAVRQKSRWIAGIALAGWDRLGWQGGIAERWMRLRDRRAPIAALVLCAAYLALILWGAMAVVALAQGAPAPHPGLPRWIVGANLALALWRTGVRAGFAARVYGWRWAMGVPVRMIVGNWILMMAARRALLRYLLILRGAPLAWEKTAHVFPGTARP